MFSATKAAAVRVSSVVGGWLGARNSQEDATRLDADVKGSPMVTRRLNFDSGSPSGVHRTPLTQLEASTASRRGPAVPQELSGPEASAHGLVPSVPKMSATMQVDTPLRKRKLVDSLEDEPTAVRACREEDAENTQPFASSDKVGAGWSARDDASVTGDDRLNLRCIATVEASANMTVGTKRRIHEAFDEVEEADRVVMGKRYRPALNSLPALRSANLPSKRPPRRHLRRVGQHSGTGGRGLGVLQRPLHCARVDQLSGAAISAAAATAPEFEELQGEMLPEELQCAMPPDAKPVVVSSLPTTAAPNLAAGSALTSNGTAASSAPLHSILGSATAAVSEPPAAGAGVFAALLEMQGGDEKGRKRRVAKAKGGGTADPSASLGGLQAGPAISFTGLPPPAVDAAAGAAPPMLFGTVGKDGAPGTSAGGTAITFGAAASASASAAGGVVFSTAAESSSSASGGVASSTAAPPFNFGTSTAPAAGATAPGSVPAFNFGTGSSGTATSSTPVFGGAATSAGAMAPAAGMFGAAPANPGFAFGAASGAAAAPASSMFGAAPAPIFGAQANPPMAAPLFGAGAAGEAQGAMFNVGQASDGPKNRRRNVRRTTKK